ncbi:putative cyclin-A3-1 isoform X2 [Impatiens glandulifera]|uniref:putative cyclin-A3-1 isoform X2 n=1 Tax=Impatiens glandulifera TaxID=253017 RepID=UPI001FB1917D|nr:putative cyclin-A3-1 isoform X2 [Impatiens glandulifera]XP_047324541.1 putative cyclin-A3-1 isoform X2 [Impatiens glandulifera]
MEGMTEEEISLRVTHRAKKRTADAMVGDDSDLQSPDKKRNTHIEISNMSIPSTKDLDTEIPKLKCRTKGGYIEAKFDDSNICNGYADDIYDYHHNMEKEAKRRPLQDYMEKIQTDVTANMRGILVDWLVEVAGEYKIQSDTLFLTVSYIDRFLSINHINRQRLQLLGVSSMLIASKFEESDPPSVDDMCYISDFTCTNEDVVKMEADILKSLKFEVSNPTILTFLRRFARISEEKYCKYPNSKFELLGCYLAELSLLDYCCLKFLPSMIASSVVFLSRFITHPDKHPWNSNLEVYSGYKASDLKECVVLIHELHLGKRGGSYVAIRDKYLQHKFKYVGLRKGPVEIPSLYFEEMGVGEGF